MTQLGKSALQGIQNSFTDFNLVKGGKRAQLGEIRSFGGRNYIKTPEGWKFHGKGTGKKAQEHKAKHGVAKKTSVKKSENKSSEFTMNEVFEKYPSKDYYVGRREVDSFNIAGKNSSRVELTVYKKTGEKTKSGRDIYEDKTIKFEQQGNGKFKEKKDEIPSTKDSKKDQQSEFGYSHTSKEGKIVSEIGENLVDMDRESVLKNLEKLGLELEGEIEKVATWSEDKFMKIDGVVKKTSAKKSPSEKKKSPTKAERKSSKEKLDNYYKKAFKNGWTNGFSRDPELDKIFERASSDEIQGFFKKVEKRGKEERSRISPYRRDGSYNDYAYEGIDHYLYELEEKVKEYSNKK